MIWAGQDRAGQGRAGQGFDPLLGVQLPLHPVSTPSRSFPRHATCSNAPQPPSQVPTGTLTQPLWQPPPPPSLSYIPFPKGAAPFTPPPPPRPSPLPAPSRVYTWERGDGVHRRLHTRDVAGVTPSANGWLGCKVAVALGWVVSLCFDIFALCEGKRHPLLYIWYRCTPCARTAFLTTAISVRTVLLLATWCLRPQL